MQPSRSGPRNALANLCIFIACVAALVALCSNWLRGEVLNTGRWVATSRSVLANSAVQSAVASYLTDQIADSPAVQRALADASATDTSRAYVAHLRQLVGTTIGKEVRSDSAKRAWTDANRTTQERLVYIINGSGSTNQGLSLDLAPVVGNAVGGLGLPLTAPAGAGNVRLLDASQLRAVRSGARALRAVALGSILAAALLFLFGILCAPAHRRAVGKSGLGLTLVGLAMVLLRGVGVDAAASGLTHGASDEAAVHAALDIATSALVRDGVLLAACGAGLALATWLLGLGIRGFERARVAV